MPRKKTFLRRTDLKRTLASIDQTFLAALAPSPNR
jgi:hypothetical protein